MKTVFTNQQAIDLINNYLGNGGLFNPEMMEHDKVRDLLMVCRERLESSDTTFANLAKSAGVEESQLPAWVIGKATPATTGGKT